MNAKYFEENGFEDFHGTKFHKAVLDHALTHPHIKLRG